MSTISQLMAEPLPGIQGQIVSMTRRVRFSSGHRYWRPDMTKEQNRELYGPWASPYNHGHNYVLDVTIAGIIDPTHGMVVNIKRLDDVLQEKIVQVLDQHSINDEVPYFEKTAPCIENLLTYFYEKVFAGSNDIVLDDVPVKLESLRLEEMPTFWGQLSLPEKSMTLTRTYEFAASHRLHAPELSPADNIALFGKCNNAAGHGHNYLLEVTVEGQQNPITGMLVDLGALDQLVDSEVVGRYDHKNLSSDLPEFAHRNATSEVVAAEIFDRLDKALRDSMTVRLSKVRLHETERNIFEVSTQSQPVMP